MDAWLVLFVLICDTVLLGRAVDIEPGNWPGCSDETPDEGGIRTNTEEQLTNLRLAMRDVDVDAYIITAGDFHLSEFVSDHDKRILFISGFSGSSGTVVVTQSSAVLWTDGRYYLQAEQQLGCNWILMRSGEVGVPSMFEWLQAQRDQMNKQELIVGACPYFVSNDAWIGWSDAASGSGLRLKLVWQDLVEKIWIKGRPPLPSTTINVLPVQYTGATWTEKVESVQMAMEAMDVDLLVVTSLHEIAWLLNLRATDISGVVLDPVFYSLLILRTGDYNPLLYIKDHERKLDETPNDPVTNTTLRDHLNLPKNGVCKVKDCVKVREYDHKTNYQIFFRELGQLVRDGSKVQRIWLSHGTNYGVYAKLPQHKLHVANTPIAMMKATKNAVEVAGMKTAHIKDGAALARFMTQLEKEVMTGGDNWTEVTELSASRHLSYYRSLQEDSRGDSFSSISSFGPHSAINHYFPSEATSLNITTESTYLLDSGGQYLDGTTDVTRTFLFRDPTDYEKECYTRVLMGHINLATAVFEKGLYGSDVDAFAREPLWDVGLIYRHGTGHGIGHYLSVHEGPGKIAARNKHYVQDVPLEENMFFSNEPGFYEAGKFGIRLENIMFVTTVETKYAFPGATMFGFETVTLFPYEPHLIDWSMLDEEQLAWLYAYNKETEEKVGSLLKDQGDTAAYDWLIKRTRARAVNNGGVRTTPSSTSLFMVSLGTFLGIVFSHL